jgi:hypothetical protein
MTRISRLEPTFVAAIATDIEAGVLYISTTYATTVHLCACGCGNKVVLPLSPAEWRLTWDGETVSLSASVGNWEYPCQSHYWIERNAVRWAKAWSTEQIEAGKRRDAEALERQFQITPTQPAQPSSGTALKPRHGLMARIWLILRRRGA